MVSCLQLKLQYLLLVGFLKIISFWFASVKTMFSYLKKAKVFRVIQKLLKAKILMKYE